MMEKSVIARLDAKLKAAKALENVAKVPDRAPEIEQLRAATEQSNVAFATSQKQIMDQLLELKAVKDAPVETPEWEFQIQRDGANNMARVIAKPLGEKESVRRTS